MTKVLTLSWRSPISYRNQSIDLLCKSMDWFLYDIGLRRERVKQIWSRSTHVRLPKKEYRIFASQDNKWIWVPVNNIDKAILNEQTSITPWSKKYCVAHKMIWEDNVGDKANGRISKRR